MAASLAGKLGFAISATFGRIGRAQIRPIIARSYSHKRRINDVLQQCLAWWLRFLRTYVPRPVPTNLEQLPTIVSYSDGEGGNAGIGVAAWAPWLARPVAAYTVVPNHIRALWAKARSSEQYNDIYLVEAVGPLVLLLTFPRLMRNALWLHFIDNAAAEAALIKGSSTVASSNLIISSTWEMCHKRALLPYFDRVESKANPVDGLSRQVFAGPWAEVKIACFPVGLLETLPAVCT